MYLIPKGIGEHTAESVLGVSYPECARSQAEAGLKEARVQSLSLSFWRTDIYFKDVIVVQSPSHLQLFATPWTAACQASPSLTVSQGLPMFMFIDTMQPSHPLTLSSPSALNPSQHQGLFH